jgi:hypothetical protein
MSQQQKNRDNIGRYKDGPKCELCGKPTGFDYFSDSRVDSKFRGRGLVLCRADATRLAKLSDEAALQLLKEARDR